MIEFMTTYEIMEKFAQMIESERVKQNLTQEELYKASGISASAYRNFMSSKNTKFENIIKLLFALNLTSKLQELIKIEEFNSLDDIRAIKSKQKIKQRVRKAKNE